MISVLRAEIAAIRATLERDDLDSLPSMLDLHSEHVQAFCARPDARAFQAEVRRLKDEELEVIDLIRKRQQCLLAAMRAERQSTQVAHAYAQVGLIR
jgi:hypothetical protein